MLRLCKLHVINCNLVAGYWDLASMQNVCNQCLGYTRIWVDSSFKCMNCIQSLWRLMYFKCFDTSGNISDIYRTKHWSSCVICAIFNMNINVFRLCGFINCQLGCTTHCLINIRHGVIMIFFFDTDFTGVPDMFFVSGESTLCSLKVICDVVSLN